MAEKKVGTRPKSKLTLYAILSCAGVLLLAVGVWLAVVLPELNKESSKPVDTRSAEEIALDMSDVSAFGTN
jgi:hypothetical protein